MEKQQTDAQILREYGIIFDPHMKLSQFGGIEIFIAFLEKAQLKQKLIEQFGFYRARTILQSVLGIVVGAKTMNDIGKIAKDFAIKKYLPQAVEEAQLGRDVRDWKKSEIEQFHDFNVSLAIYDLIYRAKQDEPLIFDVDATSVEKFGDQEGVEKGYVGADQPEKCYQYLLFRIANRNSFFYGTIRGGASHSQNDFCGYLQRFLPPFERRWQLIFRADSGYFNEKAFDLFSEHTATFFIKAPMSPQRLNLAQTSPDLVWSNFDDKGESYASRDTMTEKGTKFIEVFRRKRKDTGSQIGLFDDSDCRYDCLATNDFVKKPEDCFAFYNGRANIENNIKELKYDYQLGKIVTDDFDANDVITQIQMLTYILVTHFKNEFLPPKLQRFTLSSLRSNVLNIPSRFVTYSRNMYAKIQNVFCDASVYSHIIAKIKSVTTWLMEPPTLQSS